LPYHGIPVQYLAKDLRLRAEDELVDLEGLTTADESHIRVFPRGQEAMRYVS